MTRTEVAKIAAVASSRAALVIRTQQAYDAADAAFAVWVSERNALQGQR